MTDQIVIGVASALQEQIEHLSRRLSEVGDGVQSVDLRRAIKDAGWALREASRLLEHAVEIAYEDAL